MIVHLLNQIVIVGVISAEWYLALLTTALRKKIFSRERENYKGLKLAYQILKIVKRVTEMTRQQINVNEL